MNFGQIQAFFWLTKLKSYQKVAERVHRTQPAVSARIASLEDELGFRLVETTAPNFKLTEKGLEFVEFAEAFMNLHERMENRMKMVDRAPIVIGIIEPMMLSWWPSENAFLPHDSTHPAPSIYVASNQELRQMILEGELDIVFSSGQLGVPVMADSFRIRYPMAWIIKKGLVDMPEGALTIEDIASLPLVFYPRSKTVASPPIEAVSSVRSSAQAPHTGTSMATTLEMVRRGYGAAPVTLASLQNELERGEVEIINAADPLPPMEVRCVYINKSRHTLMRTIYDKARQLAQAWCAENPKLGEFVP